MPVQSTSDVQSSGVVTIGPHPRERGMFRLNSRLWVPAKLDDVFTFFSDAIQLEALTPPWVRFRIITPMPIAMHAGTVIDYRFSIRGLPLRWRSVIPIWEPPHLFVNEQVRGPYRYWRHEHRFEAQDGGTLVNDTVDYRVPGGWLVNRLFVQPDVERIFRYRLQTLSNIFGN